MKTVYDIFIEYYTSIRQSLGSSQSVEKGIAAYLNSIGLLEDGTDEKSNTKIAQRELARFKIMPPHTFITFFENFELREQIMRVQKECRSIAISRVVSGKITDESVYKEKIDELYKHAAILASDKRYKGWLDEIIEDVTYCLKFAGGISDTIPDSVVEDLEYNHGDE